MEINCEANMFHWCSILTCIAKIFRSQVSDLCDYEEDINIINESKFIEVSADAQSHDLEGWRLVTEFFDANKKGRLSNHHLANWISQCSWPGCRQGHP